jgi:hypothetical protein
MPDDLIKIEDTEEYSPKKIISKTLDWWDINYKLPDYHRVEDFKLFLPKKEKE